MRRAFITLAIIGLFAVPATAADCLNLTIDGETITARSGNDQMVRTALVGTFLWVQTGEYTGQDELEGTVSHDVPAGAIAASVCPDGSVNFNVAATVIPEPEAEGVELLTVEEIVELPVLLHPGSGGLQEF